VVAIEMSAKPVNPLHHIHDPLNQMDGT